VTRIPEGVGWTALLTAYGRAQESHEGTPFYDQHVLRAVEDGCRQVALVAAGLDSRAFRLGLPRDVTVFELDQPAVLDFKQAVLDQHDAVPTCNRVPVRVDLADDWAPALLAARFDPAWPTLWIAEGLLMYLSSADAGRLLATVTRLSTPGSRFTGEYFSRPWLAGHGWTPGEVTTITELGGRHGRRAPRDFAPTSAPRVWLFEGTLARRRAESRADPHEGRLTA
jgi:O-methyltransferase involved in polyketide biosynthesis